MKQCLLIFGLLVFASVLSHAKYQSKMDEIRATFYATGNSVDVKSMKSKDRWRCTTYDAIYKRGVSAQTKAFEVRSGSGGKSSVYLHTPLSSEELNNSFEVFNGLWASFQDNYTTILRMPNSKTIIVEKIAFGDADKKRRQKACPSEKECYMAQSKAFPGAISAYIYCAKR
ncbi:hypothetical protein D3C87_301390 [compost metagenome]